MMPEKTKNTERLKSLRALVAYHRKRYHTDDAPEISDEAYDALLRELALLEEEMEGKRTHSETVGGDTSQAFAKVKHTTRQWSFDNVFDFTELQAWEEKLRRVLEKSEEKKLNLTYVTEHKIDGLKMVLEYRKGEFFRALTRGDGVTGEDVTHTARTIKSLPLKLTSPVDLMCVGEVWLSQKDFIKLNQMRLKADEPLFANPRNAAAGSLRQLDPEVARSRNLSLFIYDIDKFEAGSARLKNPKTQWEELSLLAKLGLPVNEYPRECKSISEVEEYYQKWKTKHDDLPYGVDGVVIKLSDIYLQNVAGYTAKAPRFGVAYKFPAVETTTVVEAIELQVGRTGVVTPVAHLKPVLIDGSTVARATLHNEDQINRLDVRVGDTIILRKAGDVIPEVVSVLLPLRPASAKKYVFPKKVSACGGDGSIERIPGLAAYRCVSLDSDFLHRQKLYYFVSKTALNIDGVGPKIIDALLEAGLVKNAADLFTLKEADFLKLENFKIKSAQNAVEAISAAKTVTMSRLLVGLSIEQVGEETAKLLEDNFESIESLQRASYTELESIHGIGQVVAEAVVAWQKDKKEQSLLKRLLEHLVIRKDEAVGVGGPLTGKSFVFTGTLENLSRSEAGEMAKKKGGTINNTVTSKTSYVVVGSDPGSKAGKARQLGVQVLTEDDFMKLIAG